ncbi:hypothetical protein JSQ81_19980 [Sporosarcina sp. Marseille-Q4063]|uniref:hypothetical protein n=1 Tax=Sporosarcina sp. Marseille-Q4063 TaxID=2810514 RepID=UPI001BB05420|nr:hypothetical protein [Sporosarcina sp. Marseille-Q4063]QUW22014.1 hypothetical protein JSQ81_19980 [Sporosarcina sp. Marseille-Q4063]
MEEFIRRVLTRLLQEQKMFYVAALIHEGADIQEVTEAFEKSVLNADPRYQQTMQVLQSVQVCELDSKALEQKIEWVKQSALRRPEYKRISNQLRLLNNSKPLQENHGLEHECLECKGIELKEHKEST